MRAPLLCLAALALAACGDQTYVVVHIDKGAATPAGIVRIDLDLLLEGKPAATQLREKNDAVIALPTTTTLELRHGAGTLQLTATARDAGGAQLDKGSTSIEVTRGKVAQAYLTLGTIVVPGDDLTARDGAVDAASDGSVLDLTVTDATDPIDQQTPSDLASILPGPPTNVVASSGTGGATITWSAPAMTGASAIVGYTVTSTPGGLTATTDGSTLTANVSGLANGTSYTFVVVATNSQGDGPPSAPSNAVTPLAVPTAPDAPAAPTAAVAGPKAISVSWPSPNNNGSAITGFTVTAAPGGAMKTTGGTTLTTSFTALTTGTAYTFTVTATNGIGTSGSSPASNSVTAADVPSAPGTPVASGTAGYNATVTWTAATANSTPVTSYTVTASPGGLTATTANGSTLSASIGPFTPSQSYTFTVVANSAVGSGPPSSSSNSIVAGTVPAAPTFSSLCAASGRAWVKYTATGATSVNAYHSVSSGVTPSNGTKEAAITTFVPNLANGANNYIVLTAVNAYGESAPSGQLAALPTVGVKDMLVVANTSGVEMWDCFSQIANGTTGGTRTFTSNLISGGPKGGLLVDVATGLLYLSDSTNNAVNVWSPIANVSGTNPSTLKTLTGSSTGLTGPSGLAIYNGNLLVLNSDGAVRVYPLGWTTANTAPSATITGVSTTGTQMSLQGTELWVAEGTGVAGFKGVDTWTTNKAATRTTTVSLTGTGITYTGVTSDAVNDIMYMANSGNATFRANSAWSGNAASSLSGTVMLNPWNSAGSGVNTTSYQNFLAGNQLFLTAGGAAPFQIYIWTNAAFASGNSPNKTMNSSYVGGGLAFIP